MNQLSSFIIATTVLIQCSSTYAASKDLKEVFTAKASITTLTDKVIYPVEVKSRVHSIVKAQIDGIVQSIIQPLGSRINTREKIISLNNQDPTLNFKTNFSEAPVAGVLSKILVREGSFVNKGQDLFIITEPNKTYLSVEVPVKDLSRIKKGLVAKLKVAILDKEFDAKLVGKGSIVNKSSGTVTCEFETSSKSELLPGILGRIELDFSNKKKIMISESSLLFVGDKTYIRKLKNEMVVKLEVKTGIKSNGKVAILKGLEDGETYIKRSNGYLIDGDKVKVVKK